jgi:hypothetical protein
MVQNSFGKPQQHPTPKSVNSGRTHFLVEGPEPSQDFSYKYVQKSQRIPLIEQGIPLDDFDRQA